jgi:hypothetical protein
MLGRPHRIRWKTGVTHPHQRDPDRALVAQVDTEAAACSAKPVLIKVRALDFSI